MAEELSSKGTSRGEFLVNTAGVAGLVVGAGVWTGTSAAADPPPPDDAEEIAAAAAVGQQGFANRSFALELDGVLIGLLKSLDGGATSADVVTEKQSDYFAHKHLAGVKYEDFTVQVGFTMNKALYDWINASWTGQAQDKNGGIHAADAALNEKSKRVFQQALITETTIPACDGSSKDPGFIELSFSPELARTVPSSGKLPVTGGKQKQWLPANFKLEIDGLDCTKVNKIDSFTIRQAIVFGEGGEGGDFGREPGKLEFPNLRVQFASVSGKTWADFFNDFVVNGNNGQDQERNGKLTFLEGNLKDALGEIDFFNLGIFKLTDFGPSVPGNATPRMVAELYCERMEMHIPKPTFAP